MGTLSTFPHISLLSTSYVVKTFHPFPYHQKRMFNRCSYRAIIMLTAQIDILFLAGSNKLGQEQSWHGGWIPESKTSDPSFGCAVVKNLGITPEVARSSPTQMYFIKKICFVCLFFRFGRPNLIHSLPVCKLSMDVH